MSTFADRVFDFLTRLQAPGSLPPKVTAMNPYLSADVKRYTKTFLSKYYSDNQKRLFIFGINPGRFGSGITGISLTDPVAMEQYCGIPNHFEKKRETSSVFTYELIEHLGGPERFYKDVYITAVSPLGFLKEGLNYNYYDEPALLKSVTPFIVQSTEAQIALGARRDAAIILGTGQNQKHFTQLNEKHRFFERLYTVEHPRFIMQYRRKRMAEYIQKYAETITLASKS